GLAHFAVHRALDLQVVRIAEQIGGDEIRPEKPEPVAGLADHPLRAAALQVARGEVVAHGITEDVGKRFGFGDVARAPAEDDDQLRLVIEVLRRDVRHAHYALVGVERVVVLVEQDWQLGNGLPNLAGMPGVVETDADDLFRVGDARAEGDLRLVQVKRAGFRLLHQLGKAAVAARNERIHRRGRVAFQRPRRLFHVEHAFRRLYAQRVALAVAHAA